MDADKKIRIAIRFPGYVSFSSIDLTCGTDPSYKVKKSHSNVHEAEQSCSEYPHQRQNAGYAFRQDGCVWVCGEGALLAVKLCRLLPLSLSPSLSLPLSHCLSSPVSWPSDLCRSHVPDSSLGKQPIDRWI